MKTENAAPLTLDLGAVKVAEPTELQRTRQHIIEKINELGDADICLLVTRKAGEAHVVADIWSGHPRCWTLAADLMTLVYTGIVLPRARVEFAKGTGGNGAPPAATA